MAEPRGRLEKIEPRAADVGRCRAGKREGCPESAKDPIAISDVTELEAK